MGRLVVLLFTFFLAFSVYAQADSVKVQDTTTYRIVKYDGIEFIGKIISKDPREVLVLTEDRGLIYVP